MSTFAVTPSGKNTVVPIDTTAEPIIPITAGFKPVIQPSTALLLRNLSKHFATIRIIINEINTLPGFTEISMYPKLIEHLGYKYSDLLDNIIELAIEK